MKTPYNISLNRIMKDFSLEKIFTPENIDEITVSSTEVNRPGLELSGYYKYYDKNRIQIIGKSEESYLNSFEGDAYIRCLEEYFSHKPVAVIVARNLEIPQLMEQMAQKYQVPLLRTTDSTSGFMASLISFLNVQLAQRITRHGVLVEVYGEGLLILGESGVGKSETAIELVKRGHRLIADDAVEIRKVSSRSLVGSAPDNIRHFIELRGIGIVNAGRTFGAGAVKMTTNIDLVINMEPWDSEKVYDRMGLENEMTDILGNSVPSMTIPVKPGRNLAVVIEVAAMNHRQKKMGYNAANDLLQRLGMESSMIPTNLEKELF
ncbi:MAG: HPr(Ser) kinase/phosphatase [Clostridia bacterium]|nr:HPr(Ser) kinase/phosphatase [Clostridia bacterium]